MPMLSPLQNAITFRRLSQQRGLSLVELLIAIALGLFLIWGVMQSFLTSRQAYNLQQGVARIQENGRLAQEFLGFDIRNAGDYGCGSGDDFVWAEFDRRNDANCSTAPGTPGLNMIDDGGGNDFATAGFQYAVYGFDNDNGADGSVTDGTNTIELLATPVAGSDVLVLRLSEELGNLTAPVPNPFVTVPTDLSAENFPINVPLAVALAADQAVAVSDCATTKIFAINAAAVNATTLGLSGANHCAYASFQQGASVRKLTTVYYFVAPSVSGTTTSLYRQMGDDAATAEELLEGVENLQLKFGLDADGDNVIDVGGWTDADAVTEAMWNGWDYDSDPNGDGDTSDGIKDASLIRAVRYSLLLVTEDAVLGENQTLNYNGAALPTFTDRRLRQVFTSSVGIRSRLNPDH